MKIEKVESGFEPTDDGKCAIAEGGMVAAAFPEATRAGVEMLRKGGNAVDAACATALALGVCEPQASGLGGQSMAIIHLGGRTFTIDGSSRAPSLAHVDTFRNRKERVTGYRATTVPSTVAVLGYLNFRYGSLDWSTVVEPAIRIAKEGYSITSLQHDLQKREMDNFLAVPSQLGAKAFLRDGCRPYDAGDTFVQPDLARLLEHIAEHGPQSFYRGKTAEAIDDDMRANDGLLRKDDLSLIPWPVERPPLVRAYRNVRVFTLPPPAAGRTLLLVMLILGNLSTRFIRSGKAETYHFIAEAFRKAFLLRTQRPYDPNTYPQIAEKKMLNRTFAKELAGSIRDSIDPELPFVEPPIEGGETTHLSVMDKEGNAVGITQSIELVYGSKAAAAGLGFLYNNYMSSLDTSNPSHPYFLRPNSIPWTSVAPAIVFHHDKPWVVTGSPGSERIYSTICQFLLRMVDAEMPMGKAMTQPRFHCSIGGKLSLEADRFDPEVIRYLESMGYKIDRREPFSFYLGAIHAVMKCQSRSGFQGVAEIRRDGISEGL